MRSAIIDSGSKQSDIWGVLTGMWNEYDQGDWHIVRTPFFLTLSATLEAGGHPLPFRFKHPICGLVHGTDGAISSVVVRPGENSVNIASTSIVKFSLFGTEADVEGVI